MSTANLVVRPDALDYLTGRTLDPAQLPAESTWQPVPARSRRLAHVRGVSANEAQPARDGSVPFPTQPLLAGLAGERVPLAFQVTGTPGGARFALGTWAGADDVLGRRQDVLVSLLDNAYPAVDLHDLRADDDLSRFPQSAVAHGLPVAGIVDGEAPWDRLLRGLRGSEFAVLVLAEPVPQDDLAVLRDTALEDVRTAFAAQHARAGLPVTDTYRTKMDAVVETLESAVATGGWRTGVYLLGDQESYWRLAAAWHGMFGAGDHPVLPPRVVPSPRAADLACGWVLPDQPAPQGPRLWRHPYLNQTLLDTRRLAALVHFPRLDTPGFTVSPAPAFATSRRPPRDPARAVTLGAVLTQEKKAGGSYQVDLDDLTRHALVTGLTGSGKTNTLMHLLTEMSAAGVPFLVIEPAKTEYRELLARPGIGDELRVFTLGRERVAPLRINPFEIPHGTDVATHLDLLKAAFTAGISMWDPLPQILEQGMVQVYEDHGWDLATGRHRSDPSPVPPKFPTLGHLVAAVERVIPTLGFKPETLMEYTGSLTVRLNALRRGARGLLLDVAHSVPIGELLEGPTVVELEGLGDDADKAFVMGLILVRLYEHRRAQHAERLAAAAAAGQPAPGNRSLEHVTIVEEAHRLLARSDRTVDSWHADPQGAFADTFSQMLSEIRAYGQGMVIADQVPARLAPDVVKNTNLKVAHRLVAADDREILAGTMSMDERQADALTTLTVGRAAVFSEGDHTPVIVAVDEAKGRGDTFAVDDAAVAARMRSWRSERRVSRYFADPYCAGVCPSGTSCREAQRQVEDPAGTLLAHRLLTTATTHADGLDAVWPDVFGYVAARVDRDADIHASVHAFALHAVHTAVSRRAAQASWRHEDVDALLTSLRAALAERVGSAVRWMGTTPARLAMTETAAALLRRAYDPYPLCSLVCPDGSCPFKDPVTDLLTTPRHRAYRDDLTGQQDQAAYVLEASTPVARDLVETSSEAPSGGDALTRAFWRALGCAAQVRFCATDRPRTAARVVESALAGAGWRLTGTPGGEGNGHG